VSEPAEHPVEPPFGSALALMQGIAATSSHHGGSLMFALKARVAGLTGLAIMCLASTSIADKHLGERISDSRAVLQELLSSPDKTVPQSLLKNARCVAVIPHLLKAAMGVGVRHGQGVISCRNDQGQWSPPAFVSLTGASFGLQVGGESSDLVLFFMSERGAQSMIAGNKISLGGEASVAAGPMGRQGEASTDLNLKAEVYSYAKSKGLFAGMSLEGARLGPDNEANAEYYGKGVSAKQLLFEHHAPSMPAEAAAFRSSLP
jgi:lipid-binding SYLF domain-containing protein